jgi:Ras-related protein Rab-28
MDITVAIIGDGAVGKSSLINNFRNDGFVSVYKQTIGFEFYEKKINLRESPVSLRIWDIGGQSIHSKSFQQYIASSSAIFLVYDVTNTESFHNLDDWMRILKKHGVANNVYLVGNKVDMIAQRQVKLSQHNQFIEQHQQDPQNRLRGSLFLSAKTGENVVKAFYKVAAETLGQPLSEGELEVHDKILKVNVAPTGDDGGRTAFADIIEAEDRAAAEEARRKAQQQCFCIIS